MKHIKQSYPRRRELLATPFVPLSDADFRELVLTGQAFPSYTGGLSVAKWGDGQGADPEKFLVALRASGSKLEVRRFGNDANVRIVPKLANRGGVRRPSILLSGTHP